MPSNANLLAEHVSAKRLLAGLCSVHSGIMCGLEKRKNINKIRTCLLVAALGLPRVRCVDDMWWRVSRVRVREGECAQSRCWGRDALECMCSSVAAQRIPRALCAHSDKETVKRREERSLVLRLLGSLAWCKLAHNVLCR